MAPLITSLGLFLLDTFEWRSADGTVSKRQDEIVGGAGVYVMVGARLWLPATDMGLLVDRGNDWLPSVQAELDHLGNMWYYRDQDRPTSRTLNIYTGEHRDFEYLNEKTRLEPNTLPPEVRTAKWLHFVCSPTRALRVTSQLGPESGWAPQICYEPVPDRCVPSELENLVKGLPLFTIFSPNHEEAAAFFGISVEDVARDGKKGIEAVAQRFVDLGAGGDVVIRSGEYGAYVLKKDTTEGRWIPAVHIDKSKVVDVTGAGNSFLGGLMAGMVRCNNNIYDATALAAVSASFVIEQFALPRLSIDSSSGKETWNGENAEERLIAFRKRIQL